MWGDLADEAERIDEMTRKVEQVYTALASLTEGESNDLVVGAGGGQGLEAWRKLGHRWDPAVAGRRRALLKAIINPPRSSLTDLVACWERWEDMIRRYERRKDSAGNRTKLDEETRMSAFEMLIPEDIENHLMLNRKRLSTYELQKEEVNMILETRIGAKIKEPNLKKGIHAKSSSDAMDVDGFGKGGKSQSKGKSKGSFTPKGAKPFDKGKGKGSGQGKSNVTRFEGTCNNCGKYGHKQAECWSKQQSTNNHSNNPKSGKGNTGKGGEAKKGKPKGNSKGARSLDHEGEPDAEVGVFNMNAITQHTHDNENSLNAVGSHATGGNTGSSDDEWVKLNLDSGAAVTAFPESLAPPGCQGNGNNYKTATGELTPDKGQIKITGTSENKRKLRITARVANVHKPLLSASRCVNGGQCVWLSKGGGWMIETTDPVIKQVESILWKHAMQGKPTFIPVYEERGVYNVYVKKEKIEAVNEASHPGGEMKALTKDLKACTREELELEVQRLRSSFPRQP